MYTIRRWTLLLLFVGLAFLAPPQATAELPIEPEWSVARVWIEAMLANGRVDVFRPTVSTRNCYHSSAAMWDCWAAYDDLAAQVLHHERQDAEDVEAAREEAISFAAYRLFRHRFANTLGATILEDLDGLMDTLGYDKTNNELAGDTPAALGNRVAATYIAYGLNDASNEAGNYEIDNGYEPVNEPLVVALPITESPADPNRWQPLALEFFVDKTGIVLGEYPDFTTPHWGRLESFAMVASVRTGEYRWYDPGDPPYLGGVGDQEFKDAVVQLVDLSSRLSTDSGVFIDISPGGLGNNPLGTHEDPGYALNPFTGLPYEPEIVPEADYGRALAEFWFQGDRLSGPDTYFYLLANRIAEDPTFEKRVGGEGPIVNDLEWDVKTYLALGGAVYDAGLAAWGAKYFYDYVRPISMIRYMSLLGQSTDDTLPSYHPSGMPLIPGLIEQVTTESSAPGQRHAHLDAHVGKIALQSWAGFPEKPDTETVGVDWILGVNWVPYHPATFVTPTFAGYVSGHSTVCRAGAEILTAVTGTPWVPGGLGEYAIARDEYLIFEHGPSVDMTLQWATYYDISDMAGISRLWGGVHVAADDFKGRIMGSKVGKGAWEKSKTYFDGSANFHAADVDRDNRVSLSELLRVIQFYNSNGFAYSPGTEDGFAPGDGQRDSALAHTADCIPQDWTIDLSELLRVVQIYNARAYTFCPAQETEDGFCPDPA